MTNQIVKYEIVVQLLNKAVSLNKKQREASKTLVCKTWNGSIHSGNEFGSLVAFNPCQKDDKSTPVYAITDDGTRHQIDTLHFFQAFAVEEWFHIYETFS